MNKVIVIGGGLAGAEAALQLARRDIPVTLYEMRPVERTAAHATDRLAELVCSNSFGSLSKHTAPWILKRELKSLDCALLKVAEESSVPAGHSLAIDRDLFSNKVTEIVEHTSQIELIRQPVNVLPENRVCIIATGPLTSNSLALSLSQKLGQESLYFYDAISPIVSTDSLDLTALFSQSRYDKGEPDFLNIPLTKDQYDTFISDILSAQVVLPHDFEEERYFEGCMPIEALAARGPQTLAFGPMRPVGLTDPKTGKRPHAVIQLRAENRHRSAYNLVGFQTKMKYGEQERIFRKLPGLGSAEFLRLGSMHRNTFINSPQHLLATLQLRRHPAYFLAGQLTGTEGYVESIATGLIAGLNAGSHLLGEELRVLPPSTMIGALLNAITDPSRVPFQPLNANMGLLPPLPPGKRTKQARNEVLSQIAVESICGFTRDQAACKLRPHASPQASFDLHSSP